MTYPQVRDRSCNHIGVPERMFQPLENGTLAGQNTQHDEFE
jgi:hypothetical protein